MTYEEALQIAIEQLDDAVDYLKAMNKGFPKVEKQVDELISASNALKEMQTKREWVGLTDADIDDMKQTVPVYVSAKAVNAIVPMVEAKLLEKNVPIPKSVE